MRTSILPLPDAPFLKFAHRLSFGQALLLFLLVTLATVHALPAAAAVYKCVAGDGSTTYSDIPCASNAEHVDVQTAVSRASSDISAPEITSAAYVSPRNGRALDVTNQLRSQCAGGPASCIVNCSNQLAGDPDFGQRKYCQITYQCGDGRLQEVRILEGGRSTLSCAPANATPGPSLVDRQPLTPRCNTGAAG